jgi:hypothetical protein
VYITKDRSKQLQVKRILRRHAPEITSNMSRGLGRNNYSRVLSEKKKKKKEKASNNKERPRIALAT